MAPSPVWEYLYVDIRSALAAGLDPFGRSKARDAAEQRNPGEFVVRPTQTGIKPGAAPEARNLLDSLQGAALAAVRS